MTDTTDPSSSNITDGDIKSLVEVAADNEIPNFEMSVNWYTDYGMDSLGAIALVAEVNTVYAVRMPPEWMPNIRTGFDLHKALTALLTQQSDPDAFSVVDSAFRVTQYESAVDGETATAAEVAEAA